MVQKCFFSDTKKLWIIISVLNAMESQKLKVGAGCGIGKITSLMPFKLPASWLYLEK